jgi:hypothetical protein
MSPIKRLNVSTKKTPRVLSTLSKLQKEKIINYHQQYPEISNVDLIAHFEDDFKVKILPCTMSRILKKYAPKILSLENFKS